MYFVHTGLSKFHYENLPNMENVDKSKVKALGHGTQLNNTKLASKW